jgi:hypothetical protein
MKIDYRGYRLVAQAVVPVDGTNTLVYGSADGGATVHNSNEKLNVLMEKAAKLLNLKVCKQYSVWTTIIMNMTYVIQCRDIMLAVERRKNFCMDLVI